MHVLITGHTGFKGAWLTLMLRQRGHDVSGLALDPDPGALYTTARLDELLRHDLRVDVRDADEVRQAVQRVSPDAVIHLAAQPLVRVSYEDPRATIDTNVIGTMNVLDAVGRTPSVRAHLVITTDKVYRNVNQVAGYVEDDALGGYDPYSASKAMADLLVQSWTSSFPTCPTALARAGNVIGGGDVSRDRLLPDLLAAFAEGKPAQIRFPDAVRPWQHVLDCLNGYLTLVDTMVDDGVGGQWNFGPGPEAFVTVGAVADLAAELWGPGAAWVPQGGEHPHEAGLLALDAGKARQQLDWSDRLSFREVVAWTVAWQKEFVSGADARALCEQQIHDFEQRSATVPT